MAWLPPLRARTRPVLVAALLLALGALLASLRSARAQEGGSVYLPIVQHVLLEITPYPASGAVDVSPNGWLEWTLDTTGMAPDVIAALRYDVLIGRGGAPPATVLAAGLLQPPLPLFGLELDTEYTWQVRVHTTSGIATLGPVWRFTTLGAAPPATDEEANTLLDVPAGPFQMGCDPQHSGGYPCREREAPLHTVWLDAYRIDKYEVTNRQYRQCVAAGACNPPLRFSSRGRDDYFTNPAWDFYPVLYVSWWDAKDYCEWADKRLPTEAEWEKAARGPIDTRPWPWGEAPPSCTLANFTDDSGLPWRPCLVQVATEGDTDIVGGAPLGASPYGAMDMAGNAFEWVYDLWDPTYYRWTTGTNPTGPDGSRDPGAEPEFVIRGGSYRPRWFYPRAFNRHWGHHGDEASSPDSPYYRNDQQGFRCAADVE